jgi:hypothetical protein
LKTGLTHASGRDIVKNWLARIFRARDQELTRKNPTLKACVGNEYQRNDTPILKSKHSKARNAYFPIPTRRFLSDAE